MLFIRQYFPLQMYLLLQLEKSLTIVDICLFNSFKCSFQSNKAAAIEWAEWELLKHSKIGKHGSLLSLEVVTHA